MSGRPWFGGNDLRNEINSKNPNLEKIQTIIENYPNTINNRSPIGGYGGTPLIHAINVKRMDIVNLLLNTSTINVTLEAVNKLFNKDDSYGIEYFGEKETIELANSLIDKLKPYDKTSAENLLNKYKEQKERLRSQLHGNGGKSRKYKKGSNRNAKKGKNRKTQRRLLSNKSRKR